MQVLSGNRLAKRLYVALLVLAVTAILAGGCATTTENSEEAGFAGHWTCTLVDAGNGQVVSVDDLKEVGVSGSDLMTLDLNEDGTATMSSGGADIQNGVTLTWSEAQMGVEIVTSAGEAIELPYDSSTGYLSMEYQGQRIVFERG